MSEHHHRLLERALAQMGHTHTLADILQNLEEGHMQSFAEGRSWAVTQILNTPRKRVMEVFLVVGERPDLESLYGTAMQFAAFQGCDLVRAYGRPGWGPDAAQHGWKDTARVYLKEVE